MAADDPVELRGPTSRAVIAVVDAFAIAKRTTRMAVVNSILLAWAREQMHLANVIANTTRGNPPLPDSDWGPTETGWGPKE